MYCNALERGMDATGLWSPLNKLDKSLLDGCTYSTLSTFKLIPDTILMSHLRAATVGSKKNVHNAHPFHRGSYILQHNGTLYNHLDLADKYDLKISNFNVDSDIIAGCIEKCDNIKEILEQIDGPAAIIIHDLNYENRLYVFRNKERPLYRGRANSGMYMSSLLQPLKLVGISNIEEFKEDILYTVDSGKITNTVKIINKPYSKPKPKLDITVPSNYLKFKLDHLPLSIGCILRGAANYNIRFDDGIWVMKKDKYYYVDSVTNGMYFNVADIETGNINTIHYANFNLLDTIKDGDFMIALNDVESLRTKDLILVKKGEIRKCQDSFTDGKMSIFDQNHQNFICVTHKRNFRKLTDQELEDFKKNELVIFQPAVIKSAEESSKIFLKSLEIPFLADEEPSHETVGDIVINNDNSLDDDSHKESEDFEEDDCDLELNSQDLYKHFNKMDKFLFNLRRIMEVENVSQSIKSRVGILIKSNEKAMHEFLGEEVQMDDNNLKINNNGV